MKQKQLTLTRMIMPEEQHQYIELSFDVPPRTAGIQADYYVEDGECVIDLGVQDTEQVRGWSGGARSSFNIEETTATPGYRAGSIPVGEWAIILGAYRVPNPCSVTVTVTLTEMEPAWLKGDLHMHSVHSDGSYTLDEIVELCEQKGLDFIATTDHNTTSQNQFIHKESPLTIIPGMELTTNFGHCNFFGVADPVRDFRAISDDQVRERLTEAKTAGAKISLNHPHCPQCGWHWDWELDYDFVEVWNGPWREANAKTVDWWHQQLCQGKRIPAIGGSDTHRPHRYVQHGTPTVWVYSDSRSGESILRAIEQRRVSVSYLPDGPFVSLSCESYTTGDVVPLPAPAQVTARFERLSRGDRIKFISNDQVENELIHQADETQLEVPVEVNGQFFVRVEVWRYIEEAGQEMMAAMSNPMYFEGKPGR
ncbi:CehA/McbA family metallohydrolase [Alkalihalobacillus oceani]|uniref:CehA/McbA family metallohydrolase n=1 Tax=Halalkalibacter oceani TaxID=1653776 RepID=UPI00203E5A07|nr:CehA/McbA family metallohydrolase [Halalkalibacter oceani]MCM3760559.1 CehA/McbA family metallohydrolase [Halalkalibacter oceani]